MDEGSFRGLAAWVELAKHAHVLLTFNLALGCGLMNGSFGKVKGLVFHSRDGPRHSERRHAMPEVVVVDFPEYRGPPFFDLEAYPERGTWLPLRPQTVQQEGDAEVSRTQFPLMPAWALTPRPKPHEPMRRLGAAEPIRQCSGRGERHP